ncbi:hypothetical protein [Streptomyces sp. NPDC005799]|uniref:hypothetical protein n=1 Tax=Streptomyces sp. NPDC005799 TaxID=3154678 RepID=UPI0033F5C5C7
MAGWGVFADRDAVPDGDLLGADEDVLDQEPEHALAFGNVGRLRACTELGEEAFQVVGEFEVGVAVGELGCQGVELAAQVGLAGPEVGHAGPQFIDGDQLFLVCLDHAGDGAGGCGQSGLQTGAFASGRVRGAGLLQASVDLGADQSGVGEEAGDVVPDEGVEVVGADRLVGADASAFVAVVVRAQAPVVAVVECRHGRSPRFRRFMTRTQVVQALVSSGRCCSRHGPCR